MTPPPPCPQRVVLVVERLAACGTTDLALHLARRLDRRRFLPELLALRAARGGARGAWGEEQGGLEAEEAAARGLRAEGLPAEHLVLDPEGSFRRRIAPLAGWLRERGTAVVHAHSRPADLWAVWAGLRAGTPVRLYSRQATYGGMPWLTRGRYALTARAASGVIAVSEAVASHLRRREGVPRRRLRCIHDAVDLEALDRAAPAAATRARLGLAASVPLVGCAAALTARKGQAALLEAFARARRRHPTARLLLIGDGPERPALAARARALGVAPAVHFLGFRRDLPDLLAALDVFVLPSHWEGFNLSLLSACALGRAVVATRLRANEEIVAHEVSGLLPTPERAALEVSAVAPQPLAEALAALLGDPARRQRLGAAARRRVRARFGADAMAAQHEALYARLLAEGSGRRRPLPPLPTPA